MSTKTQREKRNIRDTERALDRREKAAEDRPLIPKGRNVPMESHQRRFASNIPKIHASLRKAVSIDACLNNGCRRYCRLIDAPFHVPWEGVHCPLYPNNVGTQTTTIRQWGQIEWSVAANQTDGIAWCPNPGWKGGVADAATFPVGVLTFDDGEAVTQPKGYGVPGCPRYGGIANGPPANGYQAGNCGFIQHNLTSPASARFIDRPGTFASGGNTLLAWEDPQSLGQMTTSAPADFKYRLVAAGWRAYPTQKEVDLSGTIRSTQIPNLSNAALVGQDSEAWTLPTAHYNRGQGYIEGVYYPTEADIPWNYPNSGSTPGLLDHLRSNISITNPNSAAAGWHFEYVAFYEVTGVCAQTVGDMKSANPEMGSMIMNASNAVLYNKGRAGSTGSKMRPKQLERHVEMEKIKSEPALEKIANKPEQMKAEVSDSKASPFSTFVKDVLPVVGGLLPLLL